MTAQSRHLGHFGGLVKAYEKSRRPAPVEVFQYLKSLLTSNALILDLGCGTGISTRQLGKIGKVIGCDPDSKMLQAARRHKTAGILKYVSGSAEKIPFPNDTFDAVTAFAAFHWFDNNKSAREIKRVLKPDGVVYIVNNAGIRNWGQGYRKAIIKSIGRQIPDFDATRFHPKQTLARCGFKKIGIKVWKKDEIYNLNQAVDYVQSVSIWNAIPKPMRPAAVKGLKSYFKTVVNKKGKIVRKVKFRTIFARS